MEQNSNENVAPAEGAPTPEAENAAERPVRRRASRRATAAAGAQTAETAPAAEAGPAADGAAASAVEAPAPAAEAPAAAEPAAEAPKKRVSRAKKKSTDADAPEGAAPAPEAAAGAEASAAAASETAPADDAVAEPATEEAPKKRATRSRKKAAEPEASGAEEAPVAETGPADAASAAADGADASAETPAKRTTRSRKPRTEADAAPEAPAEQGAVESGAESADDAPDAQSAENAGSRRGRRGAKKAGSTNAQGDTAEADADQDASADADADSSNGREAGGRAGKGRDGKGRGAKNQGGKNDSAQNDGGKNENAKNDRGDKGGDRGDKNGDNNSRSSRTRQRDRKRRGQNDEFDLEITEDDVLLPIAGILDVLDNYAFVRTSGYLPGAGDVYVSLGQVKKHGLRKGDAVVGAIRQPREGEGAGRQKYNALVKLDTVNGQSVEEEAKRVDFTDLTPIYPQDRLRLETGAEKLAARAIDLFAPIGKGQRGLVVGQDPAPMLREIAAGVAANSPESHLMLVLLDERPEEATEAQRTVKGEVLASTFDRLSEDHVTVAELAVERAKRLVELGHDVVLLIDSLTALGRAYVQNHPQRGSALDAETAALHQVRKLLGAARNIENGGSLTVIAAARTKTGSAADRALLRGLAGTANTEIRLERTVPGRQPVVDPAASLTLGAGAMLGAAEAVALDRLRDESSGDDAAARVVERLRATSSNAALLAEIQRS